MHKHNCLVPEVFEARVPQHTQFSLAVRVRFGFQLLCVMVVILRGQTFNICFGQNPTKDFSLGQDAMRYRFKYGGRRK